MECRRWSAGPTNYLPHPICASARLPNQPVMREVLPLSRRRLLRHVDIPAGLRIQGVIRPEWAIGILEDEANRVPFPLPVPEGLGHPATEDVDPVRDISLTGVVISDVRDRLVLVTLHLHPQELVPQHPLR